MTRNRNIGIDILKILMCFLVVVCHCWNCNHNNIAEDLLYAVLDIAVPVFFFISFVFCSSMFSGTPSKEKVQGRFRRIAIPHITWAIIFYIVLLIAARFEAVPRPTIKDLGWQLLAGHSFNRPMWYQVDLIVITGIMMAASRFLKKRNDIFLMLAIAASFVLEYTGLNRFCFNGFRPELKYTCGRLIEMFPYAAAGILAGRGQMLKKAENHKIISAIIASLVCFVFLFSKTKICKNLFSFDSANISFQYAGILKWMTAIAITTLFSIIDTSRISNKVTRAVTYVSSMTLGIYCSHFLVISLGFSKGSILWCIAVFLLSLTLSILISLIPFKWAKQSVS